MPQFFRKHGYRLMNAQATEATEGGEGGSGGAPQITPEIQALIDQQVAGLKAKNSELIQTSKAAKAEAEALKQQFEGVDIDAVKGLLKRASQDEETRMLAEGKVDEVFNRRTERLRAETDKQLKAREAELQRFQQANQKLSQRALSDAVAKAAVKAGALPTALDDIVLRAQHSGWGVNEDGEVLARKGDEVHYGKDGKTPLTAEEWADSLREVAPHLFQQPQGTGAPGSGGGGGVAQGNFGGSKQDRLTAIKKLTSQAK